jgi:hypothetical protein
MKAREIIETLCREGDDVWSTHLLSLKSHLRVILEAWSKERKQEIVDKMSKKGIHLVDHTVFGDYDIVLWKVPVSLDFDSSGVLYAASVNSEQHDPTDIKSQFTKYPGSSLRHIPAKSLIDVLRSWIKDYGKIGIGTGNVVKLASYKKMLSSHFKTISFDPSNEESSGFWIM